MISRNERRSTKTCISTLLISGICSCPLLVRLSLRERLPVPPHSVLMTASASILCQMSSSKCLRIMSNIPVNVYSAVVLYYWIYNWQILKIEKIIFIWLVCSKNTWNHTYWAINKFISFVYLFITIDNYKNCWGTDASLAYTKNYTSNMNFITRPAPFLLILKFSMNKKALCIFQ